MKLVRIVGARPQFMQAVVLRNELAKRDYQEILVHTGQHYDNNMSKCFFDELGLPNPDYSLNVGSGNHGAQTGKMLKKIEEILILENPQAVVVDGDTNSTLAGALAASKLHIPIVHVESGLRSYNRRMPEEINRIVTDHLSTLLCAPTKQALNNLEREGLLDKCEFTGDLMYDCFVYFENKSKADLINQQELTPKEYILCTIHRAENTNDKNIMLNILSALNEMPLKVVLPCHPRTKYFLTEHYSINLEKYSNIIFIDPVTYLDMIALEKNANFIVTDSGGVQREAYFAKVPSVIVRNETEWVEQLETGWSILGYTEYSKILNAAEALSDLPRKDILIYGDGNAAAKIINAIERVIH